MAESTLGGNFIVAFNPSVVSAIQDRTLARVFRDALYPHLLYRLEAVPEQWMANVGANQTFTRTGLIRPTTRPLAQGTDPTPKTYENEQWETSALQYGDAIDTHMPTSYVSIASVYLRNIHSLGLHAGQSMNRVVRDRLFNAYLAGNTVVRTTTGAGVTVPVESVNGFTRRITSGRPAAVSATNPLPITIISGGVATSFNVVAIALDAPGDEIHGGILTLDVAHAGITARDIVLAGNRSRTINSGGSVSIDGITGGDAFSLSTIRAAVAQLRADNAPTFDDGTYHCHLDPISEMQLFGDNEFQRLHQSLPDHAAYREFAVASILGTNFYRNTEAPLAATVDQDPNYGFSFAAELANASGVPIHRPLFLGAGSLEEKYLDESKYLTDAGTLGKIGEFAVQNNGMQVMNERIRLILRAPMDRLQQLVSAAWSFSGGWAVPTDSLSLTSPADYKRGVVVQHGSN